MLLWPLSGTFLDQAGVGGHLDAFLSGFLDTRSLRTLSCQPSPRLRNYPVFSRKPIFGYSVMVGATVASGH